jgi:hypothetical protein
MAKSAPTDPSTPLAVAAVTMHETVTELQAAGFTREEAIHMVLEMARNAG